MGGGEEFSMEELDIEDDSSSSESEHSEADETLGASSRASSKREREREREARFAELMVEEGAESSNVERGERGEGGESPTARNCGLPGDNVGRLLRARTRLRYYSPGRSERRTPDEVSIPEATTLVLVGMRSSGKSAVINKIIRALDGEEGLSYLAPEARNPDQIGTSFLTEHRICGGKVSLFDTRGFTTSEVGEATQVFEDWMKKGLRDGAMERRAGDPDDFSSALSRRGRGADAWLSKRRNVNFVIFVVDASSFLYMLKSGDRHGLDALKELYDDPFLAFRDDRPVLVLTHLDDVSFRERDAARAAIAAHFQVPVGEPIYDLSAPSEACVEYLGERAFTRAATALEMLIAALQKADRHLPAKRGLVQVVVEFFHGLATRFRWKGVALYILYYFYVLFFLYCTSLLVRGHLKVHADLIRKATGSINHRWLANKMRT
ncbi:hypothetical protein MPTK1_7g17710 [Marchantia polymorpha subsp. ruderalis]|uniref:G domain-containing protein n=2 Tax=Marchantia polymorpha TaxID=3197 RepID=A0AAF6C0V1_MARPO|nr:hypothetical protein MARPO_0051s0107 [Marchantia polymorpha]BBN17885.1 hypothetical protein Mp_7g17710 [Marchantia polymorpha subsp. ruderalis]|eukprot:PTQ38509.1 hypothetical protein MARPO_0051s0107 [Marchantia polymorpha]